MRGLETMQMRVALSLPVMLVIACTSIREGQPQRMKSLILPLAAWRQLLVRPLFTQSQPSIRLIQLCDG